MESQYGELIDQLDAVYPVRTAADIPKALNGIWGHRTFNHPMCIWARATAARGRSETYMYYFSHVPPRPRSSELGALHTFEIPYVFNHLAQPDWSYRPRDFELADVMSTYWVNFARTGDPNGEGLPQWVAYDLAGEPYLEFGESIVMRGHLLKAQLDLIERFQELDLEAKRQSGSR